MPLFLSIVITRYLFGIPLSRAVRNFNARQEMLNDNIRQYKAIPRDENQPIVYFCGIPGHNRMPTPSDFARAGIMCPVMIEPHTTTPPRTAAIVTVPGFTILDVYRPSVRRWLV